MKILAKIRLVNVLIVMIMVMIINIEINSQSINNTGEEVRDSIILKSVKNLPVLNNFRFISSDVINNPFITSYIKTSVGAGTAVNLTSYIKDLDGNILEKFSGRISFITADILFQIAVNNWMALSGKYEGFARLGTNTYTILTSGISYATGYSLGAKVKIWGNNKMMLSGSLDYNRSKVFLYSIYEFAKKVLESGTINKNLLVRDDIISTFISVDYAFAPADWCGLLAVAGWGVGNPFNSKDRGNVRVGLATSVDFDNIKYVGIPVGVLLSVKFNSFLESGENNTNVLTYGLRIGYTGHKDFDVGIENTYQSLNYQLSDEKINTLLTAIKLRYYF